MYECDLINKICNTVREPVCDRGGPVTAYSVTGTGPGMACRETPPIIPPVVIPPKKACKINIKVNNLVNLRIAQRTSLTTC